MTMLLLDTHVIVWWMLGNERLGNEALRMIEAARSDQTVRLSPISFWEIEMLHRKGRLVLPKPVAQRAEDVLDLPGIQLADVTPAIAVDAGSMPKEVHGDPGDRILIATARAISAPLMTVDQAIWDHARKGHLSVIDAAL